MDFNKLDKETKQTLHEEFISYADTLGGKNFFLKMIEELREQKPNPLLNETGVFHTSKVKITLSKPIFKQTFTALFEAIRKEEKDGDMLDGLSPKAYKQTMNMMRTLKSASIRFELKDAEDKSFSFHILDTTQEKKTKATFAFKAMFFYHLDEAKKALNYHE